MTTQLDAEIALLSEVRDLIVDLVPEREATIRFHHRSEKSRRAQKWGETKKANRLFEVGRRIPGDITHIGNDARGHFSRYPIRIWYQAGFDHWDSAASSDAERIRHQLDITATTTDGVQNRVIDPEQPAEFNDNDAGDWTELSLVLRVHYETTGS